MSQEIPVGSIKKTIAYFYLLSFCPPEKVPELKRILAPFRESMAKEAGMSQKALFAHAIPEACARIVAYHQGTREPDKKAVKALTAAAQKADSSKKSAAAFQERMNEIWQLPGRAKPENRLHRKKGCALCQSACRYGYFSLVSEPQLSELQMLLEAEAQKPAGEQNPFNPVWGFAIAHLARITGVEQGLISAEHLGNLAFCLLLLATAKSRKPMPEEQLKIFQEATQRLIKVRSE
jgi:cell pole-organizing protein PopZ